MIADQKASRNNKKMLKTKADKKQKKRTNLLKLCSEMNKYAEVANDKEIVKRFRITIASSVSEDISKTGLMTILKKPGDIDMADYSEIVQPYIKHYLFMIHRNKNKK